MPDFEFVINVSIAVNVETYEDAYNLLSLLRAQLMENELVTGVFENDVEKVEL